MAFQVLCYGEFKDFAAAEQDIHSRLESFRLNDRREFFRVSFEWIRTHLLEEAEAFAITQAGIDELDKALSCTARIKAVQ